MNYNKIINGCKKGKTSSQRELVKKFASIYKAICIRYMPDSQSADDAVQEAFINVFNNIRSYRGEGSFEGWMKKIAVNTALNYRKKHFKIQQQHLELLKENHPMVQVPDALMNLCTEDILKIIKLLPDPYYLVFNMYVIDGMTHKEIAKKMGVTASTSRATLSRARTRLILLLKQQEQFNESFNNKRSYGI